MKQVTVFFIGLWIGSVASAAEPLRIHAQGDAKAIGVAVGKPHAKVIVALHGPFLKTAMATTQQSKRQLYARAAHIARSISEVDRVQMRGIAESSGLAYDDVLFLNVFYSLTVNRLACRQFAAWGSMTHDGRLLHARNLDWPDYPGKPLQTYHTILNLQPKEGQAYLMLTWPGLIGVLTGTNRAGLTVAFNQLAGRADPKRHAAPTTFVLKRILRECKTLEEALALIRAAKPLDNGSVMISHAPSKQAAVVEIVDGQVGVRFAEKDHDRIGNANHPTREAGLKNLGAYGPVGSLVCPVADGLGQSLEMDQFQTVMRHKQVLQHFNLMSVVFDPTGNRMDLATGPAPAAKGPFKRFVIFPKSVE